MKKIILLGMILTVSIAFFGCGQTEKDNSSLNDESSSSDMGVKINDVTDYDKFLEVQNMSFKEIKGNEFSFCVPQIWADSWLENNSATKNDENIITYSNNDNKIIVEKQNDFYVEFQSFDNDKEDSVTSFDVSQVTDYLTENNFDLENIEITKLIESENDEENKKYYSLFSLKNGNFNSENDNGYLIVSASSDMKKLGVLMVSMSDEYIGLDRIIVTSILNETTNKTDNRLVYEFIKSQHGLNYVECSYDEDIDKINIYFENDSDKAVFDSLIEQNSINKNSIEEVSDFVLQ